MIGGGRKKKNALFFLANSKMTTGSLFMVALCNSHFSGASEKNESRDMYSLRDNSANTGLRKNVFVSAETPVATC